MVETKVFPIRSRCGETHPGSSPSWCCVSCDGYGAPWLERSLGSTGACVVTFGGHVVVVVVVLVVVVVVVVG